MNDQTKDVRRDGDTEQRILRAARSVFLRRGTEGARMQEIAEEAGVNPALLHYYFRSKDRMAAAVFRDAAGRLLPAALQVLGSAVPLEEKVERFVHLYIDTMRESPFLPSYLVAEMHHHPERLTAMMSAVAGRRPSEMAEAFLRGLGEELAARAAAGTIRPIAPEHFLVNLFGLLAMPFLAQPVLRSVFGMDEAAFARFLDERRADLPGFLLNALRP